MRSEGVGGVRLGMESSDEVLGALTSFSIRPGAGVGNGNGHVGQGSGGDPSSSASVSRGAGPASSDSSAAVSQPSASSSRSGKETQRACSGDMEGSSSQFDVEDFEALLAGGFAVSGITGVTPPNKDEDFVAYIARTQGIYDEEMVQRLRSSLSEDGPGLDDGTAEGAARDDKNQPLAVGDEEDAMSFFVRAGSWESSSSISQELASAGLEDDEDAASYLMRTGNLSADSVELGKVLDMVPFDTQQSGAGLSSSSSWVPPSAAVPPVQGKRKLLMTSTRLKKQRLFQQIVQTVPN